MSKYKVGDEVLIKAKIVRLYADEKYIIEINEDGYYKTFDYNENDIFPYPSMTAEEAWEIAKKLFADYSNGELDEIFGKGWNFTKLMELTPQEAKAKIEAWKDEKTIKVGDVVRHEGLKCVVTRKVQDKIYTISELGTTPSYSGETIKKLNKTGQHIDIDGFLKQI